MKYLIVETKGLELAILFDEILNHADMAGMFRVVSAGKCDAKGRAYGQSTSLQMKSRPEDTQIILQSVGRTI